MLCHLPFIGFPSIFKGFAISVCRGMGAMMSGFQLTSMILTSC